MEKPKIPTRSGQAVNGRGVSVLALVMLIVFLPVAQSSIVSVAEIFGSEASRLKMNEDQVQFPYNPVGPSPSVGIYDFMPSFRWIRSGAGQHAACLPFYDDPNALNAFGTFDDGGGLQVCSTDPYDEEVKGEFEGANWIEHSGCVNNTQHVMNCGSNRFAFALIDKTQDYSELVPTFFQYQMWGTQSYSSSVPFARMSLEYTISLEIWEFAFGPNHYTNTVVIPDFVEGTHEFNNSFEWSSGVTKPYLEILHIFSGAEMNQWANEITPLIDPLAPYPAMVGFRITVDNIVNEDEGLAFTRTAAVMPFEQDFEQDPTISPVYSTITLGTQTLEAINTATRLTVGGLGIAFMVAAVASTPYWNPVMDRISSGRKYP